MSRLLPLLGLLALLAGCESTHDYLLRQGYPPAYADGFRDGCSSGREAAGSISGGFQKQVPRYLADHQYEGGWDDGFRQCNAMQSNEDLRQYRERYWDERDRQWQQEKDRDAARAYRRQ